MKTVMLVDDEAAMRRLVQITLGGDARFRVLHADGAAEALRIARSERVDLALLDVGMPDMDGFTLCQELRKLPPVQQPRIVMLTARASQADRERGRAAGADEYFAKPFSPIALLDCIARLLPPERRAAA